MSKILLLDIETAPSLSYIWSLYTEVMSMDFVIDDWYILCWSAKWLGEKELISSSLTDFPATYKKDIQDDKEVMKKLWKLLDEADIMVAHNGKKFDRKKVNTRFMIHGMPPPSPYKIVDTLLIARAHFAFTSNKLGDLSVFLGLGKKVKTGGFELWKACLQGIESAWNKMIKYCKKDVILLEKVYLKLRAWDSLHPNMGIFEDGEIKMCPKCGSNVRKEGFTYTNVSKFQRYQCKNKKCNAWSRDRTNLITKEKSKSLITNIS